MGVQVSANLTAKSYATATQADAVAEKRVYGAAWLDLDDDQKDAALATATADIDSIAGTPPGTLGGFIGERASDEQPLEWPRTGTDYADDAWPQKLVDATIELAISYAPAFTAGTNVLSPDPSAALVKRKKTDVLETEYFAARATDALSMERLPAMVQRLLSSLVLVSVGNLWGAGSTVRAS